MEQEQVALDQTSSFWDHPASWFGRSICKGLRKPTAQVKCASWFGVREGQTIPAEYVLYDALQLPSPARPVDFIFDNTIYCNLRLEYLGQVQYSPNFGRTFGWLLDPFICTHSFVLIIWLDFQYGRSPRCSRG